MAQYRLRSDRVSRVIPDDRLNTSTSTAHHYCKFDKAHTGLLEAQWPAREGKLLITLLYLRLHLKYGIEFWAPNFKKDVKKLKRSQRKATKSVRV